MATNEKERNTGSEGRTPASYSGLQQRRINRRRKKRSKKEEKARKISADPKKAAKQAKKERKKSGKRSPGRRVLTGILLLLLAAIIITIIAGGIFVTYAVMTADEIDPSAIYEQLDTTSILFDDEGNELEPVSTAESRTIITYDQIPDHLKNAFIAIEDKTFFTHKGFNVIRIFGAIKESLFGGGEVSGTSTITQQLARNLYLTKERTMTRKIQEAYYTIILEKELSKEDILTAYLNTIFMGYNCSGVQAAAQAYFGMDASDLSVAQCAVLAAIPKSPTKYAPMKKYPVEDVTADDDVIAYTSDGTYAIVYNDAYVERQHLIIQAMYDQGLIDYGEWYAAMDEDIRVELFPQDTNYLTVASYFTDYCIQEVKDDLIAEYDLSEEDAEDMIYTGGLRIYTTLNVNMQETAEAEFERSSNFPSVTSLTRDRSGNILNSNGNIMLYSKSSYFNDDDSFTIGPDEYTMGDEGNLVIYHGNRLNIYVTETEEKKIPQVEFKDMYFREDGVFYIIRGGYFKNIGEEYLTADEDGDAVISAEFIAQNPDYFIFGDDDSITILPENYTLRQETIQPQGAMVVTDYHTGQIKVMVGGRSASGRMIYNRANTTRQPGSSIKPIAVYGPALQSGLDLDTGYTAGTTIKDEEMRDENGNVWPTNWYRGYRGYVTLRTCVEQSINTCAVRVVKDIGLDYSLKYLKLNGITSVVEEGATNDMNAAALGLGGMTNGISPIQMASAYGTFPNAGLYIEPTTYSIVEDNQGNVILDSSKTSHTEQVYDEGIAWIMTSILQSVVTDGIAGRAAISNQPVGGKTGTTTDNYDAWFVGFTPQFSASVWIGNDVNIELSSGSGAAASLWSRVMRQLCSGYSYGSYFDMPDNVYRSGGEYYVDGTSRSGKEADYESGDSSGSGRNSDEDDEDDEDDADADADGDDGTELPNGGSNNSNNNSNNNNTNNNSGGSSTGGSGSGGNSSGGNSSGGNSSGGRDYNNNPDYGLVNDD